MHSDLSTIMNENDANVSRDFPEGIFPRGVIKCEKTALALRAGVTNTQIDNWFTNARRGTPWTSTASGVHPATFTLLSGGAYSALRTSGFLTILSIRTYSNRKLDFKMRLISRRSEL